MHWLLSRFRCAYPTPHASHRIADDAVNPGVQRSQAGWPSFTWMRFSVMSQDKHVSSDWYLPCEHGSQERRVDTLT